MMERLTYKGQNGKNYIKGNGYYNGVRLSLDKTADRLAAYEDTGMEPEEIKLVLGTFHESSRDELNELREILKAKHEGRLVVLPCAPDAIYWEALGDDLLQSRFDGVCTIEENMNVFYQIEGDKVKASEIGKTVFLTREEAENALRGGGV